MFQQPTFDTRKELTLLSYQLAQRGVMQKINSGVAGSSELKFMSFPICPGTPLGLHIPCKLTIRATIINEIHDCFFTVITIACPTYTRHLELILSRSNFAAVGL